MPTPAEVDPHAMMSASHGSPLQALTDTQRDQLRAYEQHMVRLNQKLNLISPHTESEAWTVHIQHSLSLLHRSFPEGSVVVDWGTGGGLPAIPLAIACPHITVHAIDSVGKKVRAVRTMTRRLGIDNCFPWHGRADQWPGTAHYSVSRATASLKTLWHWHQRVAAPTAPARSPDDWSTGLLCLKGGDLDAELQRLYAASSAIWVDQYPLGALLEADYFSSEKKLIGVFSNDERLQEERVQDHEETYVAS